MFLKTLLLLFFTNFVFGFLKFVNTCVNVFQLPDLVVVGKYRIKSCMVQYVIHHSHTESRQKAEDSSRLSSVPPCENIWN